MNERVFKLGQRIAITASADFNGASTITNPAVQFELTSKTINERAVANGLNPARDLKLQLEAVRLGCRADRGTLLHDLDQPAVAAVRPLARFSRMPPAHQTRQAPSSETMQGPIGCRGVQARPYSWHSLG